MHLLYITPGFKPAFKLGGPILSVASAAEEIVKRGHRVTVFTTNRNLDSDLDVPVNQPIMVDGIEVWYFTHKQTLRTISFFKYFSKSIGYLYSPSMAKELRKIVGQVDLINTQLPFNYPTKIGLQIGFKSIILFYMNSYIQIIEVGLLKNITVYVIQGVVYCAYI